MLFRSMVKGVIIRCQGNQEQDFNVSPLVKLDQFDEWYFPEAAQLFMDEDPLPGWYFFFDGRVQN